MARGLVFLTLASAAPLRAEDARPAPAAVPKSVAGAYGGWDDASCQRSDVGDWSCGPPKQFSGIVVAPAGDQVRVWMSFWSPASICEFDGVGRWEGGKVIAEQAEAGSGEKVCRVTVTLDGKTASTTGDPNACDCGGWINARNLPRDTADASIPPRERKRRKTPR